MTTSEIKILKILCEAEEPLCAAEIYERSSDLKEVTVRHTVRLMEEKGLIRAVGSKKRTKNYAKVFMSNLTQDELVEEVLCEKQPTNPFNYVCAMIKKSSMTQDELNILKKMIDEQMR